MAEPVEVLFACIGCGTYNPAGSDICAECQRRLNGPDVVAPVPIARPLRAISDNPYAPPLAAIAPPKAFRISTYLVWIAVIAVDLGAFRESLFLGIVTSLTILPATLRMSLISEQRESSGRPLDFGERLVAFAVTVVATWTILLGSLIMFLLAGALALVVLQSALIAFCCAAAAAVACPVWLIRVFLRASSEQARREAEIRYE